MDIEVHIGEIKVAKGKDNLVALGIGSCLVITLHDSKHRIGALAHTMLPSCRSSFVNREAPDVSRDTLHASRDTLHASRDTLHASRDTLHASRDTRYVDTAIDVMLKRIETHGAKKEFIEAKLIGGANMFSAFTSNIGENNISCAKKELKKLGIAVVGECVRGSQGRSVEFAVASGIVTVKTKF